LDHAQLLAVLEAQEAKMHKNFNPPPLGHGILEDERSKLYYVKGNELEVNRAIDIGSSKPLLITKKPNGITFGELS